MLTGLTSVPPLEILSGFAKQRLLNSTSPCFYLNFIGFVKQGGKDMNVVSYFQMK